jgi:hypothetical protein
MCCVVGEDGPAITPDEKALIAAHLEPLAAVTGRTYDLATCFYEDRYDLRLAIEPDEGPCIFRYVHEGVTFCAMEKLFREGRYPLPKPLSCHLFPLILVRRWNGRLLLHFDEREECAACLGTGPLLVETLREPLVRAFGGEWYLELWQALGIG